MTRRGWTSKTVVNAILVVAVLYSVMPLTWLFVAATKSRGDLFGTGGFSFAEFNLGSNIAELFTIDDGIYGRWLLNSVLYFVVAALLSTMVSIATGYAFDKYDFRGKNALFGLVLIAVLLPSTILALPKYLLASDVGIVNTYWALLIPALVNPFGVYLARVFSEGYVPDEVLQAARVDGATELQTFRSISLPMIAPGFVTIFLFSFTAGWNNFFLPLVMLSNQDLYPVNLGLFMWNTGVHQRPELYSLVIVGSLVAVVPLIVAFVLLQRYWRAGLTSGAVK